MLLVSRYGRVMPHGATHVLWRDLVRDIEEAFTTAGMEKDPDLQVKRQVFGEQRPIELPAPREERVQARAAAQVGLSWWTALDYIVMAYLVACVSMFD